MKRILLVLLVVAGCVESDKDFQAGPTCIDELSVLPKGDLIAPEFYEEAKSGFSCEEFNTRQSSDSGWWPKCVVKPQPIPQSHVVDNHQDSPVFTSDIIEGIQSGSEVILTAKKIYSFEGEDLLIESFTGSKQKVDLGMQGQKLFSYQDKIVVVAQGELKILTDSGEFLYQTVYPKESELKLKNNELFFSRTEWFTALNDEEICESIVYVSNSVRSEVLTIQSLNLDDFSFSSLRRFYGADLIHFDKKENYIGFTEYAFESGLQTALLRASDKAMTLVSGYLVNEIHLREYGESLHTFSWDRNTGTTYSVFNEQLHLLSETSGIAPTERVKAVHFGENFSYLMTYLTVDPLFVFSLEHENYPELVGELKFPGEPRYLTDLGSDHLVSTGISEAGLVEISLFDVSLPSDPVRASVLELASLASHYDFSHKNLLVYRNHILVRTKTKSFLITMKENELKLVRHISISVEDSAYFKDGNLVFKDGSKWETIELND